MNIKGVRLMLILMCSVITATAIAQTRDSGQTPTLGVCSSSF